MFYLWDNIPPHYPMLDLFIALIWFLMQNYFRNRRCNGICIKIKYSQKFYLGDNLGFVREFSSGLLWFMIASLYDTTEKWKIAVLQL